MKKIHQVKEVNFDGDNLCLSINGKVYRFPLISISQKLLKATETERNLYQISPAGYGIHWLMIDEVLSIDCLLKLAQTNNHELFKI